MSRAGTPAPSRHGYQTSQAKKHPFLVQKRHPRSMCRALTKIRSQPSQKVAEVAKKSENTARGQKSPFFAIKTPSGSDRPGKKEKPQVRGCRTLVQQGTGRQDSQGRRDGLGWTISTPPDSNGVPRDVPNVSRGHRARFQPTKKSVLTRKPSPHQIKISVFLGPPEENQRVDQNATRGKTAHRSKPAKSRTDKQEMEVKASREEVGRPG